MHVFLTKPMARFVRREGLNSASLVEAVARAESGLIDADLGGGLIKQRVARKGSGRVAIGPSSLIVALTEQFFSTALPRANARISNRTN